jgi:hypothetical protein
MRAAGVLVLLSMLLGSGWATAAQRGMPEDIGGVPEEKEFKEDEIKLPPAPAEAALIEFTPRGAPRNRYFVDASSVTLGADWVIRYTVLVRSPSGAANVSYEALRCKTAEYKVYAYGARDGKWVKATAPAWQPVGSTTANFHFSLRLDYLCDSEAVNGRNARELVARLRGDPLNNFDVKKR